MKLNQNGLALAVCCLSASAAMADATKYPLTVENCGLGVTFDHAPSRSVSVGQAATEVLFALDLAETVQGTSVWFTDVPEAYKDINAGIERLADNDPSFESVVQKRPEVVAVQYEWHVGPEGIVATREQFHELNIPTYIMPADCVGKDNTVGSDGTRTSLFDTSVIHQGVAELAEIFDVADKGAAFVAELKEREAAAIERAEELNIQDASAVFWFSSAQMDIDPYVAGQKGAPGYMMDKLGIRNVVESDEEWPVVGWETIARANPSIIVLAEMKRRRFPADDVQAKLEFLRNDPVASQMDAVKAGRIVIMDAHAMDATLRTVEGIETLAEALENFGLAQ
ncbi:ABC transporter substrate-binding protein [Sedimentitalea sp. CY04]|uniref:ABC transporter substrate-binding protein n=1 Tax=Parasedimentitalea denitrificans TaxID=2211118 RepID=A0ABX0WFR9_9RHOB|nr:ABC transporter substrate-binding protein [Sedimentitalea sp. CY04]NIZ63195.1 ABC transporter substrate-binding protein [Sedimentitalea sp. CY04]